jgi:hypothetical protein
MKTILAIIYINLILGIHGFSEILPQEIIPKFYELLYSVEKPVAQDEINFFGGKSCDPIRTTILENKRYAAYSKSETPIWDYLRDRKDFFSTLNIKDVTKMRIQATDPVESVRLYNNTKILGKRVFVTFPTEIIAPPGGSKGTSVGIFTLGEDCYLDIGSTIIVSGETKVLIGEMHK